MTLINTGVLDFYWPEISNADFYKVKFYKNDSYSFLATSSTTGYQVTGLYEGDKVGGTVYSFTNSQISSTGYNLTDQSVGVTNFHALGESLSFSEISVDGINLNSFVIEDGVLSATGNYINQESVVNFNVLNPRNDSNILYFTQEPFLTGIKSRSINSLLDNTPFTQINDFVNINSNTGQLERSFINQLVLEDYYGSGITGNIYLMNEPISITNVSKVNVTTTSSFNNRLTVSYSYPAEYTEYFFYDNNFFTGEPFETGTTFSPNQFEINFPLDVTGYLKLIPYDWYGSGHSFYDPNYFYSTIPVYNPSLYNSFTSNEVHYSDHYGSVSIRSDYSNMSNSDSNIYLSIDSGSSSSFDSNSFFTGSLNPNSGFNFNYFNHFNELNVVNDNGTKKQPFFFNFELRATGSNDLESSEQIPLYVPLPKFYSSGISFDYENGITSLEFLTNPSYKYTGINILFSGKNQNSYEVFDGNKFFTGDINPYADIKLVHASNHNFLFDNCFISGSGLMPKLVVGPSNVSNSDATININLSQDIRYAPITHIHSYGKYTIQDLSTGNQYIGPELNDFLKFNDFNNYRINNYTYLGFNLIQAPNGLMENSTYEVTGRYNVTGELFTGYYESGSHFVYRFLPYNGYGSGYLTNPIFINFPSNANTDRHQEDINNLNDKVNELESVATKIHSDNVSVVSGNCYVNIDYSIAGFSTPPHVVGTLSNSRQEDPILGLILSGDPTTGSATFILSDTADSDYYKLKYLAAEYKI